MTNNWVDLDNSMGFFVIGANPVENHPASIAHLNTARFDTLDRGRNAALVVVDPRKTRTAQMINAGYDATNPNDLRKYDRYVRIRPGTNIAFINGVLNSIFEWMYANPGRQEAINFFGWHNGTATNSTSTGRAFIDDGGFHNRTLGASEFKDASGNLVAKYSHDGGTTWESAPLGSGWPKYCDSRILVNDADDATGVVGPILTQKQQKHDYKRAILKTASNTADGTAWRFSNMPVFAANIDASGTVFQRLRSHVAKYDATTAAAICGCTTADIAAVRDAWIATSRFASSDFGAASATLGAAGYRSACIMYAMGATQFTSGSQGVRSYAVIQTLMGNMGRAGGGINALRGIHNVQGSTDMGLLFDLIPGYSGNPGVDQTYADYSNKLFGNRVLGTTSKSAYNEADIAWQQRGFYNMTREWFGSRAVDASGDFDKLYACWPKGNGVQHIESFRRMDPDWIAANPTKTRIKAAVVWGQNPAITEPNQGKVRKGLENLDLLVVVDMFAQETAQCHRKADGVTYLLPACSHVEEAGSVTSSGRWIQWRDKARNPKGNSKSDLELLLRFAKALDATGAFGHIESQWTGTPLAGADAWTTLYAKYGWSGTGNFEDASGVDFEGNVLKGSEYVAEQIFKEMCSPLDGYTAAGAPAGFVGGHKGTMWIYSGNKAAGHGAAYNPDEKDASGNVQPPAKELDASGTFTGAAIPWDLANRAKSRKGELKYSGAAMQYPRYGWAWLLNRRIFYNNAELSGDVGDVFVAPGYLARLWTIAGTNTLADWSWLYRAYNQLKDVPDVGTTTGKHVYPGRFPAFTEPYETPYDGKTVGKPNNVAAWGQNTADGTAGNLIFDSARGESDEFPLVMTSIRCVEHFQGGPITRNNPWNHEAEPEPWVEINSVDAIKYGIKDGQYVNVITARGNSTTDQASRTKSDADSAGFAKGFKARVGVGLAGNQRVAPGTVAIPWHWGERGLSKGSRANDLCIDAWDANTTIPEYKACLCKIVPIP
ncbi:MAG: molybdopterin-dependent oxidoreductase [Coriobacteriia bacterium]